MSRHSAVPFLCALVWATVASGSAAQGVPSPHGRLPADLDCSACHTAEGWSPIRATPEFEHGAGGFLLTGAHERAACASCHVELRFDEPRVGPEECGSCHLDVHEGTLPGTCTACHTTTTFADVDGETIHARTAFPLTGAHLQVTCASCHQSDRDGAFSALESSCSSCHLDAYTQTSSVDHAAAGYPTECTQCHTTLGWQEVVGFDHLLLSGGFELLGAHGRVGCGSCHTEPGMALTVPATDQNDCVGCHESDFARRHASGLVSTGCTTCHDVEAWGVADFDHLLTGYPLEGGHAAAPCTACHEESTGRLHRGAPASPSDCVSCHAAAYDAEHRGSGFPTTCASCHGQSDWDGASFDHAATAFPLEGGHAGGECAACHGPPVNRSVAWTGPGDCVACHRPEYDGQHPGAGYPTTCLVCHSQQRWTAISYDHGATAFPLLGAHRAADCADCHGPPEHLFAGVLSPDDCASCHQEDYDGAHPGGAFPTTCLDCHTQTGWPGARFDHTATTGFALDGPHVAAPCESCHTLPGYGLRFALPAGPDDCVSCHGADYDDAHAGSGFPTTCLSCHRGDTWEDGRFDHAATTGFALDGPHVPLDCTACHAVPGYVLLFPPPAGGNDCVACHQSDFDRTHAGSGFPTTCLSCHDANTWQGATFDHMGASGGFRLLGAHETAECASCHVLPTFVLHVPVPADDNDCVACHRAEHDAAHGSDGFPTRCVTCHSPDAWEPSTFDHDAQYFPIYSGPHREPWSACSDCHSVPGEFEVFSCLSCHEHRQSAMDEKHRERGDYAWESSACLSCHPTGRS